MNRYWFPHGARTTWDRPEPGSLVATRRAVFRIVEYRPYHVDQWTADDHERVRKHGDRAAPYHVILRPAHITSDDVRARDHDKHYTIRSACFRWHVYPDEHYPVCGNCGEPTPCREREATREADRAMQWMARYENPDKCPGCQKTVTKRGKHITFPNVHVPLGPPVTFHLRGECAYAAMHYEKLLPPMDPAYRITLSCEGHLVRHSHGPNDCTRGADCPGLVEHKSFHTCFCQHKPDCPHNQAQLRPGEVQVTQGCPQESHEDAGEPGGGVA